MWTDHRTGSKVSEERERESERNAWIWERMGAIEGGLWTLRVRKPSEEIFEQATPKGGGESKSKHTSSGKGKAIEQFRCFRSGLKQVAQRQICER